MTMFSLAGPAALRVEGSVTLESQDQQCATGQPMDHGTIRCRSAPGFLLCRWNCACGYEDRANRRIGQIGIWTGIAIRSGAGCVSRHGGLLSFAFALFGGSAAEGRQGLSLGGVGGEVFLQAGYTEQLQGKAVEPAERQFSLTNLCGFPGI